ncbi:MAG: hypothetical protein JXB05_24450 [Myxococcaceae bacterium]|nr:hypothetical protein [Myxococcaceae bacterium]
MAKIGGHLPPTVPRPSPSPAGKAEPAATPQQQPQGPASQATPAKPAPVAVQAQQVAQQFGSAFQSAGRLAGQLFKGLGTKEAGQSRGSEKSSSSERTEEGKGEQGAQEAGQGPDEAGGENPFMAAFGALKRSRQSRLRKAAKKRAGQSSEVSASTQVALEEEEEEEEEQNPRRARNYLLGEEQEETPFDQAKREALFLQHLEREGEPASNIARLLNAQLGVDRDREFKDLLTDQVKPQLESMASRVAEAPADERRTLAALVSRAAYQVGSKSSGAFTKLLASAGVAEAAHLATSSEAVVARATQFEQALRRAASPEYRSALIDAGRATLEQLARDAEGLTPEERHPTWISLLRSAESLEPQSLPAMAEAVVSGILATGRAEAAGTLAEFLPPALKVAPGGGSWAFQLALTLFARGEVKAAEQLGGALHEWIRQARGSCTPIFKNLRELSAAPSGGASEATLLRELEAHISLLAATIPACAYMIEHGQGLPPAAAPLLTEATVSMASLNIVGATAPGQQLLRRMLLAQERGGQTFLTTLPRLALALSQKQLVQPLWNNGLLPASYQFGGRPFLDRVALHTGRALAAPVLARSKKGDEGSAKVLLRTAILGNAALFGLKPDGAHLAAEALESLRQRPGSLALRRTLELLEKIREKQSTSSTETLQELAKALADRESRLVPLSGQSQGPRVPTKLSLREIAMDQSAHAKQSAAPRDAPAPPLGGAPRSHK